MSLASLIKKGSLQGLASAKAANPAKHGTLTTPTLATLATLALAKAPDRAANDPAPDADRWCWPHSAAMTGAEIGTFTARLSRFTDKGLNLDDGEALADRLVKRDRDLDDRHLCLECLHLAGHGSWRCSNWQRSGIAGHSRDAQLPGELVCTLQRCGGFSDASMREGVSY
jgi:hypothetical protein